MPDTHPPPPGEPAASIRTCPDCGGILEPTQPRWTVMVNMVAGTPGKPATATAWQCLICGYKC